jgi:hypothetical protein
VCQHLTPPPAASSPVLCQETRTAFPASCCVSHQRTNKPSSSILSGHLEISTVLSLPFLSSISITI